MLKHFIHSSFSKSTTSLLCSLYYRYSSKSSSFFCILSFLVRAISIDQTFYSATHYLAAVWLDSRHDLNTLKLCICMTSILRSCCLSFSYFNYITSILELMISICRKLSRNWNNFELMISICRKLSLNWNQKKSFDSDSTFSISHQL